MPSRSSPRSKVPARGITVGRGIAAGLACPQHLEEEGGMLPWLCLLATEDCSAEPYDREDLCNAGNPLGLLPKRSSSFLPAGRPLSGSTPGTGSPSPAKGVSFCPRVDTGQQGKHACLHAWIFQASHACCSILGPVALGRSPNQLLGFCMPCMLIGSTCSDCSPARHLCTAVGPLAAVERLGCGQRRARAAADARIACAHAHPGICEQQRSRCELARDDIPDAEGRRREAGAGGARCRRPGVRQGQSRQRGGGLRGCCRGAAWAAGRRALHSRGGRACDLSSAVLTSQRVPARHPHELLLRDAAVPLRLQHGTAPVLGCLTGRVA